MAEPAAETGEQRGVLRRELRFWEAIALSIGIMAPMAAMALNGVVPASLVGQAVPLAFLFAAIGVAFVSYGFVRLTRYFAHAGSSYALTGATLGPRAGFFSGWALLGTYGAFTAASTAEVGLGSGVLARRLQGPRRCLGRNHRPGVRLRVPLLGRFRGRRGARGGDEQPAPQHPARNRGGGRLHGRLLHHRHDGPVARLRPRQGRRRELRRLIVAAARPLGQLYR